MDTNDFPSGPWTGFYTHNGVPQRHRQDVGLTFAKGRITGEGNDDIGPFVTAGRYDPKTRECYWTKTYVGAHDVYYRGFREAKGIWGTWEIGHLWRGGFHIWPLGRGNGDAEAEEETDTLLQWKPAHNMQSTLNRRRYATQKIVCIPCPTAAHQAYDSKRYFL